MTGNSATDMPWARAWKRLGFLLCVEGQPAAGVNNTDARVEILTEQLERRSQTSRRARDANFSCGNPKK